MERRTEGNQNNNNIQASKRVNTPNPHHTKHEYTMNFTFNEPVLVRNHKDEKWNLNYFERYVENDYYPFKMNDETFYRQCIPYVGNEDLCYTTLEPKTLRLSKKITHYRPKRHETYFTIYFCDYITGFGVIADEWWDNPGTDEIRLKAGHVFMPAVTVVMDSVIERVIIHTSRLYANLHKDTVPPVTMIPLVIVAYITHFFS